jgi:hypothetical protein
MATAHPTGLPPLPSRVGRRGTWSAWAAHSSAAWWNGKVRVLSDGGCSSDEMILPESSLLRTFSLPTICLIVRLAPLAPVGLGYRAERYHHFSTPGKDLAPHTPERLMPRARAVHP